MAREIVRAAEKELSDLADTAAEQFDSTLLFNRVHETVDGQHTRDHSLAAWLDARERAYELSNRDDIADPAAERAFSAGETMTRGTKQLVWEQVARACATVVLEADDWTDAWDQAHVDAAQDEAALWLADHQAVVERVGLDEDLADVDALDVVCGACGSRYQIGLLGETACPGCERVDWEVA